MIFISPPPSPPHTQGSSFSASSEHAVSHFCDFSHLKMHSPFSIQDTPTHPSRPNVNQTSLKWSLKCLSQKEFLLHCVPIESSIMSVYIISYLYYNHLFSMPPSLHCGLGGGQKKYILIATICLTFTLYILFLAYLLIYILLLILTTSL